MQILRKHASFPFSSVNNDSYEGYRSYGNFITVLCLVGRRRHVTASARPIDVIILVFRILLASILRLDPKCVSTEVVSLGLQQVCREVFRAVPIIPAESSAESGRGYSPQRALADNVSPAILSLVDGFVEEVVE